MKIYHVQDYHSQLTLASYIKHAVGSTPHSLLNKLIRKGAIRVNGKRCKLTTIVKTGDVVKIPDLKIDIQPKNDQCVKISKTELNEFKNLIVFEDDQLFILNKPEGMAVQGGHKIKKHVDAYLEAFAEELNCRPHIVHRLDQGTSGLLVIAKNPSAANKISEIIRNQGMKKTYLALVVGTPEKNEGCIDLSLSKVMKGKHERIITSDNADSKDALTFYKVLNTDSKISLLELKPQTGRTHQLRAHCAYGLKTPILGDIKYGGKESTPFGRENGFFLHAFKIEIPELSLKIQSDIPNKFFSHVKNFDGVL